LGRTGGSEVDDRTRNRLRAAGVPPRYELATFDGYQTTTDGQKKALAALREYADRFQENRAEGRSLILTGSVGTGKTHLMIALIKRLIDDGYRPRYLTLYDYVHSVRETWRRGAEKTEREVVTSLAEYDLLLLDEVGVQVFSDNEMMLVHLLIDGRYQRRLPTVIASNLDMKGILAAIGERAMDRLREGNGRAIVFKWKSARQ